MKPENIQLFWDSLWQDYINRVKYAKIYQKMIINAGGTVSNDHIAFRSLRLNININKTQINLGIKLFEPILNRLGYEAAGEYFFPDTHLYACHYKHPEQEKYSLPKLFISELIVEELPDEIAAIIRKTVSNGNFDCFLQSSKDNFEIDNTNLILNAKETFTRHWQTPYYSDIQKVNQVSQYGAWILLHGYAANHFTADVNRQNTPKYPNIEITANGLADLGIPMKAEIEGSMNLGLRQTATHAVNEQVTVIDDSSGVEIQIPWTYAYYELAQRYVVEIEPGKQELFDAFLGDNARQLFEMTRLN
ncbi:DUF1338 domain-containing protein [Brunnivagina elsteri]|uniref:2-oxoadipate dioxygenase/decarboxylase n=1 Tax=Brunnivagina elsteri CCALA 953 TaxID=987040 RepID=A0A2A2TI43_9CYAN|nr:DUF1338 domain-containing protein [Calothrix elsteri]PAX53402.1 DUF1338 domain-containing protein [Calothrix elsteri CCALA 953]